MESQHMTQQTFSDFIGISSASLSSIFNDRTKPTLNTVEAIRNKFPTISLDWLMYGKGVMFLDDSLAANAQDNTHESAPTEPSLLFDDTVSSTPRQAPVTSSRTMGGILHNNHQISNAKIIDKYHRNITEIRIFFDDQTWETFVPKMSK